MGIQGLIQFLEKASSPVSLQDIRGHTVAIDSYCWLHRGAFGCAEQLSRGEDTDKHIQYCLKFVNLLLSYDIKPILVFDGKHLPAKALTEKRRKESRDKSRRRAAELLRLGQIEEARSYMRRCIDITHEMAHRLIVECRKKNVDSIVAPYEADAQLAYLNRQNIAHYVITEDSDLVLFGCSKVIFKLDLNGQGVLVDADKLHHAMGCRLEKYSFEKFRRMCILSGCDYLDSLPGIGLVKACKFFVRNDETDMRKALPRVPGFLNLKSAVVAPEYVEDFLKAEATFQFMFVYDPIARKLVRLNQLPEDYDVSLCSNAGSECDSEMALHLALGNLNPFTLDRLDSWTPDKGVRREGNVLSLNWSNRGKAKHRSIWQPNFMTHEPGSNDKPKENRCAIEFKTCSLKTTRIDDYDAENDEPMQTESEILSMYSVKVSDDDEDDDFEPPNKRRCSKTAPKTPEKTPTKSHNPFFKTTPHLTPPKQLAKSTNSFLKNLSPRKSTEDCLPKLSRFNRTVVSSQHIVVSRFFETRILSQETDNEETASDNGDRDEQKLSASSRQINPNADTETSSADPVSIINRFKEAEDRQRQQTALYLSSPEAALSDRGDKTPPRSDSSSSTPVKIAIVANVQSFDSGIEITDEPMSRELLEKFEFKTKRNAAGAVEDDGVVVISDEESVKKVEKILAAKPKPMVVRRVGLSKPRTKKTSQSTDSSQSRLSKYFFQKRPALS